MEMMRCAGGIAQTASTFMRAWAHPTMACGRLRPNASALMPLPRAIYPASTMTASLPPCWPNRDFRQGTPLDLTGVLHNGPVVEAQGTNILW